MPERRTHDYAPHGVIDLFAAFNITDGAVISQLHPQHRVVEFKKFLVAIDKAVPAELDVHLVCDNLSTHKTPAVNDWLAKHPLEGECPIPLSAIMLRGQLLHIASDESTSSFVRLTGHCLFV